MDEFEQPEIAASICAHRPDAACLGQERSATVRVVRSASGINSGRSRALLAMWGRADK